MKKYALAAVAVALSASVAHAATITYTLAYNDAAASTYTGVAGSIGVYATVSSGDNAGLVGYAFTLNAGTVDLTQSYNTAVYATYTKTKNTTHDAGFDLLRSADNVLSQGGSQNTVSAAFIPAYGFGQQAVDLTSLTPSGYSAAISPDPSVNPSTASILLFAAVPLPGHPTSSSPSAWFNTLSASNNAGSVWVNNTGTTVNGSPTIAFAVTGLTVAASYNYAYDAGTVATTLGGTSAGALNIKSPAPGYYTDSPVLTGLTSAKGYVTLSTTDTGTNTNKLGIGAEHPVFVLIDYNLGSTSLATLESDLTAVSGSQTASIFTAAQDTTGQFAKLQAIYGTTLFPSASSLLFELTGATASTPNFGWDLTGSGVTVANVVAVPEPASIGLLALGALGLIGRRRSSK